MPIDIAQIVNSPLGYAKVVDGGTLYRCYRFIGAPPGQVTTTLTAGEDVDGVCGPDGYNQPRKGVPALPGIPMQVEAAAAFSSGASLETTSNGRVQAVSSGKAIMRALEASGGAGSIVWAVFTSGR